MKKYKISVFLISLFLFTTICTYGENQYKNKILSIYFKSSLGNGVVIKNAQLEESFDKIFIVGIGVDSGHPDDWNVGKKVLVPLDEIAQITVFNSIEELQEAYKRLYLNNTKNK